MRPLASAVALVVLGVSLICCGSKHSQIRFVHACPDVQDANHNPVSVDVLVDGHNIATNLAFPSYTGYQTNNSGNHDIEVRYTGTTTDLVNAPNVDFFSHGGYTIFFTGRSMPPVGSPNQTINPVNDDNTPPASGNIKLRFFHASPCAGDAQCLNPESFDIYVVAPGTDITNVSPNVGSLAYQQVSNYLNVAAATYEIILTQSGTKVRALDETPPAFTAGQIRTFVVLDIPGGGSLAGTLFEVTDLN